MSRLVLLAARGTSTNIVYNALVREFGEVQVILEESVPRSQLLKRRVKTLGIFTVAGQILFMLLVERFLRKNAATRSAAIKKQYGLDDTQISGAVHKVHSVNSDETKNLLKNLKPQIVVINGTRIISQATLDAVEAPFINMHAGITPTYRGVHGGYWAFLEGHPELAGTTIHFVDKGIDTGKVINQAIFKATADDSFVTYPLLQLAVGVPLLVQTVHKLLAGNLKLMNSVSPLPSQLRSHPTLWGYLAGRLRGIK